jgi:hypothetical protein
MKRLVAGGALLLALCSPGPSSALEEVPFVTTPTPVVQGILDLAAVGPSDFIIDLGSGDGRIVIAAAHERGARGFGVEIDGRLVDRANEAARVAGVADRAEFLVQDIFETVLSPATVVTMYLLPDVNLALRPRLLGMLRPGTRIVTHDYDLGDWEPDARVHLQAPGKTVGLRKESDLFLWVVPADVTGRWRGGDGTLLEFTQRFQKVSVRVRGSGRTRVLEGRLRGEVLDIPPGGPGEPGWRLRVEGERLIGTRVDAGGVEQAWLARRDGK